MFPRTEAAGSMKTSSATKRSLKFCLWMYGLAFIFAGLLASTPARGGHVTFMRVDQEKPGGGALSQHHSSGHKALHPLVYNFGTGLKQASSDHSHMKLPRAAFTAWNAHHPKTSNSNAVATHTTDYYIFGSGNVSQNVCWSSHTPHPGLLTTGFSPGVTQGGLSDGVLAPAGVPVIQAVPEPTSIVMLGIGVLAIFGFKALRSRRLWRLNAP